MSGTVHFLVYANVVVVQTRSACRSYSSIHWAREIALAIAKDKVVQEQHAGFSAG